MAENLPNDDEMVTEINLISQDYVEDDSVIAEVVADVTKKVSRVVTRGFTKWFFSSEISHGVSFDVTVNNDSIEDSSTDDDEFVKVSTKKRRVTSLGISASDKNAFNRKIDTLVQKNKKSHIAK